MARFVYIPTTYILYTQFITDYIMYDTVHACAVDVTAVPLCLEHNMNVCVQYRKDLGQTNLVRIF